VADSIDIEDDVSIGDNVTIRCKTLRLRRKSQIDSRTVVYGILTPESGLELGQHTWIYPDCHINTDHRVTIGDRTAAGSHCLIFTHSSYLPITHGYPVTIQPVEIASDVWLPWHVFVLPGAKIGKGATVGAFSLVAGEIPANSLAVGVPARVVKDSEHYRRKYGEPDLIALVHRVVGEAVHFAIGSFKPQRLFFPRERHLERESAGLWVLREGSERFTVVSAQVYAQQPGIAAERNRTLFVSFGDVASVPPESNWIDPINLRSSLSPTLAPLLQEVVDGLSAFGIRFGWIPEDEKPSEHSN